VIGRTRGWSGYRGRSIVIIPPSTRLSAPLPSRSSMDDPRLPCYRTSRDPPRRRSWITCCPAETRSSRRSASGFCRLNISPRSTTMPPIAMRSSRWATGCGCACSIGPQSPSTPTLRGSLGHVMRVHSRSLSGSALWLIVSSFHPGHGFTTSSMWGS
jgi:hypothetical protein